MIQLMNRLFVSIWLLLAALSIDAAPYSYFFNRYQMRDGLPSNTVFCTVQDHFGFIWIGTSDGISLYDGYYFTYMGGLESDSLMGGMATAKPSGMSVVTAKRGALEMAVVCVVNALGNIYDPATGNAIAQVLPEKNAFAHSNTTISCVITNAKLSKAQANKLADVTQDAYARCIRPVHTGFDGDSVFVLASGEEEADVFEMQLLAQELCEKAIIRAVRQW